MASRDSGDCCARRAYVLAGERPLTVLADPHQLRIVDGAQILA
jgi:hypothetical protein